MPWQFFDSNGNDQVATAQYTVVDYGAPLDANWGNIDTKGFANVPDSYWHNNPMHAGSTTSTINLTQSTSYAQPFHLPYEMNVGFVRMTYSMASANASTTLATSTANVTASLMSSFNFAMYQRKSTGANSVSLYEVASGSVGFTRQSSISINGSQWTVSIKATYPTEGNTTTFSVSYNASSSHVSLRSNDVSQFTGNRWVDVPFLDVGSLGAGNLWMVIGQSTSFATNNAAISVASAIREPGSQYIMPQVANITVGPLAVATNASQMIIQGVGSFSTAGGGTTSALALTNISSSASYPMIPFAIHRTI